jgi:hypothetical protein
MFIEVSKSQSKIDGLELYFKNKIHLRLKKQTNLKTQIIPVFAF